VVKLTPRVKYVSKCKGNRRVKNQMMCCLRHRADALTLLSVAVALTGSVATASGSGWCVCIFYMGLNHYIGSELNYRLLSLSLSLSPGVMVLFLRLCCVRELCSPGPLGRRGRCVPRRRIPPTPLASPFQHIVHSDTSPDIEFINKCVRQRFAF